jgi:hypothetical protein
MNASPFPAAGPFPPTSRYSVVAVATIVGPAGVSVVYLRRRFVPPPERFALLVEHVVHQGERLDNVAAQYLDDPVQFWRLCDANRAMRPDDLVGRAGRRLSVTLPEGIPASGGLPSA